ncbi:uncharacterized protein [Dysidea avara]|uniref:uncharacterized protein n=1 Tax=Dysidea avara TaxID=196820 RepID=UPI00332C0068
MGTTSAGTTSAGTMQINQWYYADKSVTSPDLSIAPSLLCPSADKVDLERLLQEIPKYQPWVSPLAFEQWGLFADEASTLLTTVNPDVLWDLPILQVASNSRPATSSTDNQLSDETRALLEKQSRIPKLINVTHPKSRRTPSAAMHSTTR